MENEMIAKDPHGRKYQNTVGELGMNFNAANESDRSDDPRTEHHRYRQR
jgi:hypothetical protein